MTKKNILGILACFAFLIMIVAACSKNPEIKPSEQNTTGEAADTGILSVKSIPSPANVYVNGEIKGDTPLELYNMPVGEYKIAVKKQGYLDFEKLVALKVGRTSEVEAKLAEISPSEDKQALENKTSGQGAAQKAANESSAASLNIAVVNGSFIVYYDFKNGLFTEITSGSPDVFSQNYGAYLYFTAISPSRIGAVDKPVKDATKWDCMNVAGTIGNLYSGKTLCVITAGGRVAAIGGNWTNSASKLEWQLFS